MLMQRIQNKSIYATVVSAYVHTPWEAQIGHI